MGIVFAETTVSQTISAKIETSIQEDLQKDVSATVSIRESEWADVGEWMWENRDVYNGLSVLPYDGGNYDQAPFEDCSKETYEAMLKSLTDIDLTNVYEADDNTNLTDQAACAGGACEIT